MPQAQPPLNPALREYQGRERQSKRLPDGSLNLEALYSSYNPWNALTPTQKRLKEVWPEIILASQAPLDESAQWQRNKVSFPPTLKLTTADHTVLDKLHQCQIHLVAALRPYENGAARVALEMSGDFTQLRQWSQAWRKPSWEEFVEAVIQVLDSHKVVFAPISAFATLLLFKDEVYHNYACRLRDAFFRLDRNMQQSHTTRQILWEKLKTYMPTVYTQLMRNPPDSTADAINITVIEAKLHDQKAIESAIYRPPRCDCTAPRIYSTIL